MPPKGKFKLAKETVGVGQGHVLKKDGGENKKKRNE